MAPVLITSFLAVHMAIPRLAAPNAFKRSSYCQRGDHVGNSEVWRNVEPIRRCTGVGCHRLLRQENIGFGIGVRSSSPANRLNVNRSRTSFGSRALICHAAHNVWNSCLPAKLTNDLSSIASFKRCPKTNLWYRQSFNLLIPADGPPRMRFIITL